MALRIAVLVVALDIVVATAGASLLAYIGFGAATSGAAPIVSMMGSQTR